MLAVCGDIGQSQGPRFAAFFGCMYYAMMRPSEVAALTRDGCHLPREGWGYLAFSDSSPAAGKVIFGARMGRGICLPVAFRDVRWQGR